MPRVITGLIAGKNGLWESRVSAVLIAPVIFSSCHYGAFFSLLPQASFFFFFTFCETSKRKARSGHASFYADFRNGGNHIFVLCLLFAG